MPVGGTVYRVNNTIQYNTIQMYGSGGRGQGWRVIELGRVNRRRFVALSDGAAGMNRRQWDREQ